MFSWEHLECACFTLLPRGLYVEVGGVGWIHHWGLGFRTCFFPSCMEMAVLCSKRCLTSLNQEMQTLSKPPLHEECMLQTPAQKVESPAPW